MRLFELNDELDDPQDAIIAISRDCKPFLKAINYDVAHYPLYRGLGQESDSFIIKSVRLENREPSDSPQNIHDALNDYFTQTFGEPFRNAMFAAGTQIVTASFGNLYIVFPAGKFTFVWSPEVTDLVTEYIPTLEDILDQVDQQTIPLDMSSFMNTLNYTNGNLKKAIESNKEIMIRCEQYYGIRIMDSANSWEVLEKIANLIMK